MKTNKTVLYVLEIDGLWLRITRNHLCLWVCHQDLLVSFSLWPSKLPTLGFICVKLRVLKFPVLCWLPSPKTSSDFLKSLFKEPDNNLDFYNSSERFPNTPVSTGTGDKPSALSVKCVYGSTVMIVISS